jgi:excisionase family DNA binding protein
MDAGAELDFLRGLEVAEMETLFTVAEAAALLKVSTWTVRSWLTTGRLERKKLGSRVVITATELNSIIKHGLRPARGQVKKGAKGTNWHGRPCPAADNDEKTQTSCKEVEPRSVSSVGARK